MTSVHYYNENAKEFYMRTIDVDMSVLQEKFLEMLPKKARILDAGCGVGRDAKYFFNKGHDVAAFDASIEMVKLTERLVGFKPLHLSFNELSFENDFDGIWASASLLHVPYQELQSILERFHQALKPSGTLYASFKYGNTHRQVDGRDFYDMNETLIQPYLEGLFHISETIKRPDTYGLNPSPERAWLSIFCKKTCE